MGVVVPKGSALSSATSYLGGMIKSAAGGCVATSGAIFIAGGVATIATWGAAAAPSAAALVGACVNGAVGGAATYMIIGDQDTNDTSAMYDVWEYFHR